MQLVRAGWLAPSAEVLRCADASQPEDWDEEEDGEWEPPKITNPKCTEGPGCGEWKRPKIPNPAFKGKWSAPFIDNPAYKVRILCKRSNRLHHMGPLVVCEVHANCEYST